MKRANELIVFCVSSVIPKVGFCSDPRTATAVLFEA